MSTLHSRNSSIGAVKLVHDISKLFNSRQGSDIQFHVGGGTTDSSLSAETMYAHSVILRCRSHYFADMFENGEEWKKCSDGIIYRPKISPSVFHKVLEYIYTGDTYAQTDILVELITVAEEMELEELSIECQVNVIKVLEQAFLSNGTYIYGDIKSQQSNQHLPLSVSIAVRKILLPALKLAYSHTLSDFFRQLLWFTVNHINIIFGSSHARVAFLEDIPTQIFRQILASDELQMQEYDVWKLAFSMACHKSNVMQSAVEAHFKLESYNSRESKFTSKVADEEGSSKQQALISEEHLEQFKDNLTPWLPAIRFSLIEGDQYSRIVEVLSYVLPARRLFELQRFYAQSDKSKFLDLPRLNRQPSLLKNENIDEEQLKSLPIIDVSLRDILESLPKGESSPSPPQTKTEEQLKSLPIIDVSLRDILESLPKGESSPSPPQTKTEEQLKSLPIIDVSLRDILESLPKGESSPSPPQAKTEPPPPQPKAKSSPPSQPNTDPPPLPKAKPSPLKSNIPSDSRIIIKASLWLQIKLWIFESDGLVGCLSNENMRFDLLFRASEHKFLASAFHTHCDNKGPTLVVIESQDGHKFGGVNFAPWKSVKSWSGTTSNFLVALEDGRHREISEAFSYCGKTNDLSAARNDPNFGPRFGPNDIQISDKANITSSTSHMPISYISYDGTVASNNALAGRKSFLVKEYEVFLISAT